MTNMQGKVFCFLDCETTGLDPKRDCLLEVAWQFTDHNFDLISEPKTFVVDHGGNWIGALHALREASRVVQEMHANSGLVSDMLNSGYEHLADLDKIHNSLIDDLDRMNANYPDSTIHLAGDSVWFDKEFLHENSFSTLYNEYFHHRLLDLSSIKVFLESQGIDPAIPKGTHRALDDVHASIDGARALVLGLKHDLGFDNAGRKVEDFL